MAKVMAKTYLYDDEAATVRAAGAEFEVSDAYASSLKGIGAVDVAAEAKAAAKPARKKAAPKKGA